MQTPKRHKVAHELAMTTWHTIACAKKVGRSALFEEAFQSQVEPFAAELTYKTTEYGHLSPNQDQSDVGYEYEWRS